MGRNVLIAQSGGPSPVINCSLRGVIDACRDYPDRMDHLYAACHGIEGVLREELLDLSAQDAREIELLSTTPAAGAIGTCRYKLKPDREEDFLRVIDVFRAHDIGFFFYNGGNDSMDTADKISRLAREHGLELVAVGIPKTIDNDVGDTEFRLIDHTPGYGSTARFWAYLVQNANEENAGSCPSDPVLVMQVMGRSIGYIPAAARLADPDRRMPLQIYMPEAGHTLEQLTDNVNDELLRRGRCMVVVSEGFVAGDIGERRDSFGHVEFGACDNTVQQVIVSHLNKAGLKARGMARGQVAGTDQRSTAIYASTVDMEEAYRVGRKAVDVAVHDGSGWMATILREPGTAYAVRYEKVMLRDVANSERTFPLGWLTCGGIDVSDDFLAYARPLIGDSWPIVPIENGLQRFARLRPVLADKRCAAYQPRDSDPVRR